MEERIQALTQRLSGEMRCYTIIWAF